MPPLRRRTGDEAATPDSPEALLISAYLLAGKFTPHRHGVQDEDIVAWQHVWKFCMDYQEKEGTAPPLSLIERRFPDFEVVPDMKPTWASQQVIAAANSRDMRGGIHAALKSINEDDLLTAYTSLEKVKRPRGFRKEPTSIFDHQAIADRFEMSRIEVPYPTLMHASSGGIAPSELWYIGARFGQGKSWEITGYASAAAKGGASVAICSYEMPAAQVAFRSLRRMAGRDRVLQGLLSSDVEADRKEAADIIASHTPGSIKVFDPSHGRINTNAAVHDLCEEYDLVICDHVGLMQDAQGRRAQDDWRVMATISNILRETTLETQGRILGVAQINREGGKTSAWSPPKADHLAQSDSLGQDADVIVTLKRPGYESGGRVMIHTTAKMRDAAQVKWYSHFEPYKGIFHEITQEEARELDMVDEANAG